MATAETLLHPVRMRIVQSLLSDELLTTQQLRERLPDIAIATLYRQVAYLAEVGLIEVASEQQVRGTSEKTYRVAPGFANPSADELAALTSEQLLTAFSVFSTGLIRDFDAYLETEGYDLTVDRVGFTQADFWASTAEVDEFAAVVSDALQQLMSQARAPGRRRRKLTTVLLPRPETDLA